VSVLFSGKIPSYVAARLTARYWVPHLLLICHYLPLFETVRHYSHYSRLLVLFAIRYSGLFAVRYSRLFAIRYSGFPDTHCEPRISSAILWSVTQINHVNRARVLLGWQSTTHVCQSFTRQMRVYQHEKVGEKIGENRGKFHLSPTVCQRVCRLFLCRAHTPTWVYQHEFANFSLPCEGRFTHTTWMPRPQAYIHAHARYTHVRIRICRVSFFIT